MFLKAALFFLQVLQITLLWDAVQTNYYVYSEYDNISLPLNEIFGPWGYASSSPHKIPGNWIRSAALLCTYNTGTGGIMCSNLIYRTRRGICRIYFRLEQLSNTFITSSACVDWSQRNAKGFISGKGQRSPVQSEYLKCNISEWQEKDLYLTQ